MAELAPRSSEKKPLDLSVLSCQQDRNGHKYSSRTSSAKSALKAMSDNFRRSARLQGIPPTEGTLADRLSCSSRGTAKHAPRNKDKTSAEKKKKSQQDQGDLDVPSRATTEREESMATAADGEPLPRNPADTAQTAHPHAFEFAGEPCDLTEIVTDKVDAIFGRWTQEMASRTASQGQMYAEMLKEELEATRQRMKLEIKRQLRAYAPLEELETLKAEVASLRAAVSALVPPSGQPSSAAYPPPSQARDDASDFLKLAPDEYWASDIENDHIDRQERPKMARSHRPTTVTPLTTHRTTGPRAPGLQEMVTSDPRYKELVSYRRYRLLDTSPYAGPEVTRNIGQWTRRLQPTMAKHIFDGTIPVACLRFLSAFKRALDDNGLSEGAGLKIWPSFLEGDAQDLFVQMKEDGYADIGGFHDWPSAVQFFLQTYARDEILEQATEEIDTIRQKRDENVASFARRLHKAARDVAGAFSQQELMTRFMRGVREDIRVLLRRIRHNFSGPRALQELCEEASALEKSHDLLNPRTRPGRVAFSVEDDYVPNKRLYQSAKSAHEAKEKSRRPDNIALAKSGPSPYAPSPPTTIPSTEYTDYGEVFEDEEQAPPDPYAEVYALQQRRQVSAKRPIQRQQPRSYLSPMDICFTCYIVGHRSPSCTHADRVANDEPFQRWTLANYHRLQEWQRMWLNSINRAHPKAKPPATTQPVPEHGEHPPPPPPRPKN